MPSSFFSQQRDSQIIEIILKVLNYRTINGVLWACLFSLLSFINGFYYFIYLVYVYMHGVYVEVSRSLTMWRQLSSHVASGSGTQVADLVANAFTAGPP